MNDHPILFSGPMVCAILAGTKTQTRRILTPQNLRVQVGVKIRCPYGGPGDRLWVRETLKLRDPGRRGEAWCYLADAAEVQLPRDDPRVPAMLSWAHHKDVDTCVSIHMPRWASRIDLEVSAVRVDRLQDITEADADAEGIGAVQRFACGSTEHATRRGGYACLWDEINGKRAPWASNPWVWVIGFRRVRP